jgi:hypothetical protein
MIIFLDGAHWREKAAGRYETVLYYYLHNMLFCGYGFYLHWGISTQSLWWGQGTTTGVYQNEMYLFPRGLTDGNYLSS